MKNETKITENKERRIVPVNLGPYLDFENLYYVDDEGNIFTKRQSDEMKLLKPSRSNKYRVDGSIARTILNVALYTPDDVRITRSVHRIVLESFTRADNPVRLNYMNFSNMVVDHIDGNPLNNKLSNLRWLSNFENNNILRKDSVLNWDDELKNEICELYFKKFLSIYKICKQVKRNGRALGLFLKGILYPGYVEKWCKKNKYDYEKILQEKRKKFPNKMKNINEDKKIYEEKIRIYEDLKKRI